MGKLIFRAFPCEMELDYITVSRLFLVSVAKCLWKQSIRNWFQLIYPNLSWLQSCVLQESRTSTLCIWLRNILRLEVVC